MHDIDAANCRVAKKIGDTPDFEPLGSVTRGKALRFSPPMLSLRAMGEGGWRTEADLFDLGLVADPICKACFGAVGTYLHRCVACPARKEEREKYGDANILEEAQSEHSAEDPLFKYGMPIKKKRARIPRFEIHVVGNVPEMIFTG